MRADLLGRGWGRWRGGWQSARRLLVRAGRWALEDAGREVGRWDSLADALMDVWPDRRVRGTSPWAVGFIGYEEVARLAEELPTRERSDAAPAGLLLLEPEPVAASTPAKGRPVMPLGGARWSLDAASFRDGVEKIRERIAVGDVYQVNLCRRLTVEGWEGSLGVFAEVASDGGVPDYLARIDLDGGELLCASMEMLLRRRGVELETRPIKGTRPRGTTLALGDLSADAVRGLVEEFVTRDGTDYGAVEQSVEGKIACVMGQLESGEARIVFDPETESANIVMGRDLAEE